MHTNNASPSKLRSFVQAIADVQSKKNGRFLFDYNRTSHESCFRDIQYYYNIAKQRPLNPQELELLDMNMRKLAAYREQLMEIRDTYNKQALIKKYGDLDAIPVAQAHLLETDNLIKDSGNDKLLDYIGLEPGSIPVSYGSIIKELTSCFI